MSSVLSRNCPECSVEMFYTRRDSLMRANQKNAMCRSCNLAKIRQEAWGGSSWNANRKDSKSTRQLKSANNAKYWLGKERAAETVKQMRARTGQVPWNKGRPTSLEVKKLLRLAAIKYRQGMTKTALTPNYNRLACRVIEEYGKRNGLSFQHAENGGEFFISELGYWVDGYDPKRNTVIEYYERHHRGREQKDLDRQIEIIQHLGCEFIILQEY